MTEQIPLCELWPLIREVFDRGGSYLLSPGGVSMLPTIRPGEDRVRLIPPVFPLQVGQVALFRRENGSFVLHRVYRRKKRGDQYVYTMLGDNQLYPERGIRQEQVLALAEGRERAGRYRTFRSPALCVPARIRQFFFPLKSFCKRGARKLWRICRKTKPKNR